MKTDFSDYMGSRPGDQADAKPGLTAATATKQGEKCLQLMLAADALQVQVTALRKGTWFIFTALSLSAAIYTFPTLVGRSPMRGVIWIVMASVSLARSVPSIFAYRAQAVSLKALGWKARSELGRPQEGAAPEVLADALDRAAATMTTVGQVEQVLSRGLSVLVYLYILAPLGDDLAVCLTRSR